ncbi:hypothetical protein MLD52_16290 [Puniceicoccaceae bacterium K14]|nr:hypothetical protein [Puniceicoccaceae bacterium K14]
MRIEVFALCDAATDYNGRLNILGAFEGVSGPVLPVIRERCSVVARMRFETDESGPHTVSVRFQTEKGEKVMPELKADFAVAFPAHRDSVAINLVMNIGRLKLNAFGKHEVLLKFDGTEFSKLPLYVMKDNRASPRNRMNN